MDDLNDVLETFERIVRRQTPGFALVVNTLRLVALDPHALGVIFYLTREVFQARPGALVMVNGGRFIDPHLEHLIKRLSPPGVLHVVSTPDEAETVVQEYCDVCA